MKLISAEIPRYCTRPKAVKSREKIRRKNRKKAGRITEFFTELILTLLCEEFKFPCPGVWDRYFRDKIGIRQNLEANSASAL